MSETEETEKTPENNVVSLKGGPIIGMPRDEPQESLIRMLEKMLGMAKTGELQSFVGTGFMADKCRVTMITNLHPNVYEMAGAIEWLKSEYMVMIDSQR